MKKTKSFDELLDIKYGKIETKKRDEFEREANQFIQKEVKPELPYYGACPDWGIDAKALRNSSNRIKRVLTR